MRKEYVDVDSFLHNIIVYSTKYTSQPTEERSILGEGGWGGWRVNFDITAGRATRQTRSAAQNLGYQHNTCS
jgi:hypothetical protein